MRYIKKVAVTSMETTGRIIDSMNPESANPTLNAPSIHSVRQFLSSKIIDALTSDNPRHDAPSIQAVNDALDQINSDINHFKDDDQASPLTRKTMLTFGLERGKYLITVRADWTTSNYYQEPQTGTYRYLILAKNAVDFYTIASAPTGENDETTNCATFILDLPVDTTFTCDLYHDCPHVVQCWVEVDTMKLK